MTASIVSRPRRTLAVAAAVITALATTGPMVHVAASPSSAASRARVT